MSIVKMSSLAMFSMCLISAGAAAAPTYTNDIKPILDSKCVSCHGEFADYAGASGSAAAIKERVTSGDMPQGGSLTAEEISLISQWVDAGAPQ